MSTASSFEVEGEENHEDDDGDGGSLNPCVSICCGIILLLIAPYWIWHTEGDYKKTEQMLNEASTAVEPCLYSPDGTCSSCDMNKLLQNGKPVPLVFLACKFENLKTLTDARDDFKIKELRDLVEGDTRAGKFQWKMEMWQFKQDDKPKVPIKMHAGGGTGALCPNAERSRLDDDSDPGATQRAKMCCAGSGTPGGQIFQRQYVGRGKQCHARFKPNTPNTPPQPQGLPDCKTFCTSRFDNDKRNNAIDATMTLDKYILACTQQQSRKKTCMVVNGRLLSAEAADLDEIGVMPSDVEGVPGNETLGSSELAAPARLLAKKEDSRRRTDFTCKFPCRHWSEGWSPRLEPNPAQWVDKPKDAFDKVEWIEGDPAKNVKFPFSGDYSNVQADPNTAVKIGGLTLDEWNPTDGHTTGKLFNKFVPTNLATPTKPITKKPLDRVQSEQQFATVGTATYNAYNRSAAWTAETTTVKDNCLISISPSGAKETAGDMRICFNASTLTKMSVVAAVKVEGSQYKLVVSKTQLRAKTMLRADPQGYRVQQNKILSKAEFFEKAAEDNTTMLYAGRIIGPLILWAAFYCCLSPIVWLIDKIGDGLEGIPCIGDCLGCVADVLETIAECMICVMSCCMGFACGFLAIGIAWMAWNPMKGLLVVLVAGGLFAAAGVLAYSCKGGRQSRRKSARQPQMPQAVQMQQQFAQPAMAQPAMAQPAMAQPVMAAPAPQLMPVTCPEGCGPGSLVTVMRADGQPVTVQVPDGVYEGQIFNVQV